MQQKGVTLPIMAPVLKRFCGSSMGENMKGMHAFPMFECPNGPVSFCFWVWVMEPTSRGGYRLEDEEERPNLRDNPVILWQIPQLPCLPILQRVECFFDAPLSTHASTLRYRHEGAKGVDARRNVRGQRIRKGSDMGVEVKYGNTMKVSVVVVVSEVKYVFPLNVMQHTYSQKVPQTNCQVAT